MKQVVLDLHIHSRYSRACSKQLELPNIAAACERKGIDVVVTGDFTHPAWLAHIKENLQEDQEGVYRLKNNDSPTRFILGTEVACIYKHKNAVRRVHLLLLAPHLAAVDALVTQLTERGVNLKADGRPIMGISAKNLLQLMLDIDPRFTMIPAHAWTPWFAVFGSKSGYDSLEDCFEELTPHIRAIETGLSSDPPMNRRLSRLDGITLVSSSDAHSLEKLGREANMLQFEQEEDITFSEIKRIIETGDKEKFLYTIEFYPEEGKYHFDGHRDCKVCLSPVESKRLKNICPVCKKPLTIGVVHRIDDLADREEKDIPWSQFIPHRSIVPLCEIIASVFGVGVASKRVAKEYQHFLDELGSEFFILLTAQEAELQRVATDHHIVEAILQMRSGNVRAHPGYDGVYGRVDLIGDFTGTAQTRLFE